MATFVLVAGAWHGAWCWQRVVPQLKAQGHRVLAPDLMGMGEDRTPLSQVTLAAWADQIAGIVRAETEPVVLVGHSRGGLVISETAERVPDRIAKLVYLAAVLLINGESLTGDAGSALREAQGSILNIHPDGTSTLNPAAVGAIFYSATPPEWVERAAHQVGPEPMVVFATPLQLTPERYGRVPRAYVECAQDRTMSLERQRQMQARVPCESVVTLESDHSPFFSRPSELVAALSAIAAAART